MRKIEIAQIERADLRDGFPPRFDMQLRWDERRNGRPAADAHTGNVPAENIVVPVINVMMACVTGRGDGPNFKRRHTHDFIVFQNSDALRRYRYDATPERLHVLAENARGGLDQFRWIDKVRRTAWVHVNGCSQFSKAPRRTRVIEMNVTEENVAHIFRCESHLAKIDNDIIERRFRTGIEKRNAFVRFQRSCGNDAGTAKLASVQN